MLIGDFPGAGANNRAGAMYVKSLPVLMFLPVILLVVIFYALDLIDYVGAAVFSVLLGLFILAVAGALMVLDHSLGRSFTRITVYSNGVEMRSSWLERLKKIPSFVPRGAIEKAVFSGFGYGTLQLRDEHEKRLGSRGKEEASQLIEALRSRLQISVDDEKFEMPKGARKVPVKTQATNGYCNGCGYRLEDDELFCNQCGRRR